ncbi:protein FAR1-RELATED SEQUENCE 5-like [Papaver somniferum]|uniref:protein FAR1-RELATED SEQUENCE 5-like n=1 Tax=Papaver somniferum TaxID=3469 RepID=UPI000E6F51CC|nr:protein FAR1-RELATED SEQUENCE 5-like [Papaver somniferum]
MIIRKKTNKWVVTVVIEEHNHILVSPKKRHKLISQRHISEDHEKIIDNIRLAGIKTNLVMNFFGLESGGVQNIGFTTKDVRNYLSVKRSLELKNGDAQAVLDYFEHQQADNPSFFYYIQVDSEGQMTNFFWADAKSRMDYFHFGDVVCFDPTYCTNRYGMPFVPIVGINHHYQTILFGGALLHKETKESFDWVRKTWMRAMHAAKHLSHIINAHADFTSDFNKCLYGNETIEEFESAWASMLRTYELEDNKWLLDLYKRKEKWASVYTRDIFCADMYTTQRSESINAYFNHFMKRDMPLCEFIRQFDRAILARREAENDQDYETKYRKPMLKFSVNIYTKSVFRKFQEQLAQELHYNHDQVEQNGTKFTFRVWWFGHEKKNRKVVYDSDDKGVKCSCQLYEFAGYLCRHILKIFSVMNVQGEEITNICRDSTSVQYSYLCQEAINIVIKGSTTTEIYNVTKCILDKALKEVDDAMRNLSIKSKDQTMQTRDEECLENTSMAKKQLIRDPTIAKTKGRTGRMKACIDKRVNKKQKATSPATDKTSKSSAREETNLARSFVGRSYEHYWF